MRSNLLTVFLIAALLPAAARAVPYENNTHEMAAGNFLGAGQNELAYIRGDGTIYVQAVTGGPAQVITLPGVGETALQLVAADTDADGRDELAVVTSLAAGLRVYDFDTNTFSAPAGGSINDISSANIDADGRDEIMVTNTSNLIYIYESGGYTALPGAAKILAAGEFDGDASTEFLVTVGSGLYYWNGETSSYTAITAGGGAINRIATGNLNTNDAIDEVFLTNTSGNPYVNDNGTYFSTGSLGTELGVGRLDADLPAGQELAYIISAGGDIQQSKPDWPSASFASGYVSLPKDATSDASPVGNNGGFIDMLVADFNNDGLDEIVGRRAGDQLFIFHNGAGAFQALPVPEPATAALALLTLGGLGAATRRRRAA